MKNLKLINTELGTIVATIEMGFENNTLLFIGRVVGFEEFFCYADSEESCEAALVLSFEIYLDMLIKYELKDLGIKFSDEEIK
ncbi:MAG: hypothetical protein HC836_41790 [Richelia sp. RM2_1_2]|nr:hypothetical protein [Richelia sp. RM2_1_2]